MRAEDAKHCAGQSAFACAFVALENENGLADYVRVLESVGEPTDDVETGLWIACAEHVVDVIVHQLPAALTRESSKPAPQVQSVAGKDLWLVWSEGDAVVGQSARMA